MNVNPTKANKLPAIIPGNKKTVRGLHPKVKSQSKKLSTVSKDSKETKLPPIILDDSRRTRSTYDCSTYQAEDIIAKKKNNVIQIAKETERQEAIRANKKKRLFSEVTKGAISKKEAAECLQMPVSTFSKEYERHMTLGDHTAKLKRGRLPLFDDIAEVAMVEEIRRRGSTGSGFDTHDQFKQFLERFWRETLCRRGVSGWETRQFCLSDSKFFELQTKFIPEITSRADKNNKQRLLCRVNMLVPLTTAAVLYSTMRGLNGGLYPDDPTGVPPALIFGEDTTTLSLEPSFEKCKVRTGPGTKAMLRGEGLSVKTTDGFSKCHFQSSNIPSASTGPVVSYDVRKKYDSPRNIYHPFHCSPAKESHHVPICCMPSEYQADENYTFSHCGIALDFTMSVDAKVAIKIASITDNNLDGNEPLLIELCKERRVYLVVKGTDTDELKLSQLLDSYIIFPQIDAIRNGYEEESKLASSLNLLSCTSLSTTTSSGTTLSDTHTTSESFSTAVDDDEMSLDDEDMGSDDTTSARPETVNVGSNLQPRIMLCMDGKGEPLEARMAAFEDDDGGAPSTLPSNVSQVKYHRASTALFAFNDTTDFHSNIKSNVKNEKDIIMQGDEGRLPLYMGTVDTVFKSINMKPGRRHTYFKFLANFEHWVESAASYGVLKDGIRKSGLWPFSLWQYLSRFAGSGELSQEEYDILVDHFPHLVDIAYANGFVDPSFVEEPLHDFVSSIHYRTLSKPALELLKAEELKKQTPFSERNLKYWGCTHVNNANVLRIRRGQKAQALDDANRIQVQKKLKLLFNALKVVCCISLPASSEAAYKQIKGRNAQQNRTSFIQEMKHNFLDEGTYLALRCVCKCAANKLPFAMRFCPTAFSERRWQSSMINQP